MHLSHSRIIGPVLLSLEKLTIEAPTGQCYFVHVPCTLSVPASVSVTIQT